MKHSKAFLLSVAVPASLFLSACQQDTQTIDSNNQTDETQQKEEKDTVERELNATEAEAISSKTSDNTKNKSSSTSHDVAADSNQTTRLKDDYMAKLEEEKENTKELRANPSDSSTYAMKGIEGTLFDTWNGLLNEIYGILENQLSTEAMESLRVEQHDWIKYRDQTSKEASLKYKGGTQEQLEYVAVENNLTMDRCFELVKKYM
ncbi:lysozyme inhibitor LprI family protein [Marinilactibacillus psychrotolerans]|uniref:DUF1311 domain-containing protein n=2 Tax=Marinilactibacillus psychrotolerans TaxID=191770 RepID=A0A5R9C8L0_9LACT|nr:lysozyme inhibitor LprI family protein [Marinilactibacillus psychrotolerans]TLQ09646.1 DUF1311 domain-containing protein [Marinilactibacillus psychrotolerans]GEQ33880.1 hypothetical protein B795N_17620 [Marinilactibacillus psychrotolerans]